MSHRTMDTLFPFFLYVFPHLKKERKKKKVMVDLGKPDLLWENRKSKLAFKLIEPKTEVESNFPRSLEVCFKAKLQQEGSCDFK